MIGLITILYIINVLFGILAYYAFYDIDTPPPKGWVLFGIPGILFYEYVLPHFMANNDWRFKQLEEMDSKIRDAMLYERDFKQHFDKSLRYNDLVHQGSLQSLREDFSALKESLATEDGFWKLFEELEKVAGTKRYEEHYWDTQKYTFVLTNKEESHRFTRPSEMQALILQIKAEKFDKCKKKRKCK